MTLCPLWLLEIGRFPDALVQVAADPVGVPLAGGGVPATAEPAPDTTPGVAGAVGTDVLDRVQPPLVPHETGTPDAVGQVRVHGRRCGDARPGRLLIWVAVLQDPVALRALAGFAVDAQAAPGRAAGGVG